MKKIIPFVLLSIVLSSCATVLGGKITQSQKTKPTQGKRKIRAGFLAADIACGVVPLIVDFKTGAIYKKDK